MKLIISVLLVCFLSLHSYSQEGQLPTGLKTGIEAPLFEATDSGGNSVALSELLKKGPVVLVFYRGLWCPYCNKYLSLLQDSLLILQKKGANVVAVSPEVPENTIETVKKTKASFPVVSDKGMNIMKMYKVNYAVDAKTLKVYSRFGIDFNKANGENGANLPVPATYVIGKDGKIKHVFFNPDIKQRPQIKEIMQYLQM